MNRNKIAAWKLRKKTNIENGGSLWYIIWSGPNHAVHSLFPLEFPITFCVVTKTGDHLLIVVGKRVKEPVE